MDTAISDVCSAGGLQHVNVDDISNEIVFNEYQFRNSGTVNKHLLQSSFSDNFPVDLGNIDVTLRTNFYNINFFVEIELNNLGFRSKTNTCDIGCSYKMNVCNMFFVYVDKNELPRFCFFFFLETGYMGI